MQKKQKTILIILGLFVVAALIFFLTYNGKPVEEVPAITATSTATTTVTNFEIKTESFTDSDPTYDITVEYPQFVNAKTGSVEDRMNIQFKKEARGVFEETSADLKESAVGLEGRDIIFQRQLKNDRTYINNETGIMSFVFDNYSDMGGAHGTFFYSSETVNIKTGEKIVLADLFTSTSTQSIIKEIDSQIRSAAGTCLRCDSLAPELENLKVQLPDNYLLSDQGITFLFGAYELGSYAATAAGQEVFIHKDFLNEYIVRTW